MYISVIAHTFTMHPTGGTFQGMLTTKFIVTKRYPKEQFRYVVCTASCNSKTISIACVGAPTTTADLHNFHSLLFMHGYLWLLFYYYYVPALSLHRFICAAGHLNALGRISSWDRSTELH